MNNNPMRYAHLLPDVVLADFQEFTLAELTEVVSEMTGEIEKEGKDYDPAKIILYLKQNWPEGVEVHMIELKENPYHNWKD